MNAAPGMNAGGRLRRGMCGARTMIIIFLIMNVGKIFNADFGLFYNVPQNSGTLYAQSVVPRIPSVSEQARCQLPPGGSCRYDQPVSVRQPPPPPAPNPHTVHTPGSGRIQTRGGGGDLILIS